MIKEKVVVIGAGVGGLTAAHELIERDFDVEVWERKTYVGGKAASSRDLHNLPIEHGFRFFPSWYRHLTQTLGRIPVRGTRATRDPSTVADRLVPVHHGLLAYYAREPMPWITHVPRTANQARTQATFLSALSDAGLSPHEMAFAGRKLAQFFATPEAMRLELYEKVTWWDYMECDSKSTVYQTLINASTRLMVAAKPKDASAYTIGRLVQRTFSDAWTTVDRVLDGPTSEVWLHPWADYLTGCGAKINLGWELASIVLCPGSDRTTSCGDDKTPCSGPGPAGGSLNAISYVMMSRVVMRYFDSLRQVLASLRPPQNAKGKISEQTQVAIRNCHSLAVGILGDRGWTEAVDEAFDSLQRKFELRTQADVAKDTLKKAQATSDQEAKLSEHAGATLARLDPTSREAKAAKEALKEAANKAKKAADNLVDAKKGDKDATAALTTFERTFDSTKEEEASIVVSTDALVWAIRENTQDTRASVATLTGDLLPWLQPADWFVEAAILKKRGLAGKAAGSQRPWQRLLNSEHSRDDIARKSAPFWTSVFDSLQNVFDETRPADSTEKPEPAAILEALAAQLATVTTTLFSVPQKVEAQYFVFALPLEQMAYFANRTAAMTFHEPPLGKLINLLPSVSWMSGIQFYLKEPCHLVEGHLLCMDSEWSLTAIEQTQFWGDTDFKLSATFTNDVDAAGQSVKAVLSVDISTWDRPGRFVPREALNCTRDEIAREVWGQLKASVSRLTKSTRLRDDMLLGGPQLRARVNFNLDENLADVSDQQKQAVYERARGTEIDFVAATAYELPYVWGSDRQINTEPMLLSAPGTHALRPNARTGIENMFLAADYVHTDTDLACMEGANEAGRRAANAVLETSGSLHPPCEVWTLSLARDAVTAVGRMFGDGKGAIELAAQSARTAGHLFENLLGVTGLTRIRSPRSGHDR